jgi:hypothetical protein
MLYHYYQNHKSNPIIANKIKEIDIIELKQSALAQSHIHTMVGLMASY